MARSFVLPRTVSLYILHTFESVLAPWNHPPDSYPPEVCLVRLSIFCSLLNKIGPQNHHWPLGWSLSHLTQNHRNWIRYHSWHNPCWGGARSDRLSLGWGQDDRRQKRCTLEGFQLNDSPLLHTFNFYMLRLLQHRLRCPGQLKIVRRRLQWSSGFNVKAIPTSSLYYLYTFKLPS